MEGFCVLAAWCALISIVGAVVLEAMIRGPPGKLKGFWATPCFTTSTTLTQRNGSTT